MAYWYLIFGAIIRGHRLDRLELQALDPMQIAVDRLMLRIPVVGESSAKATIARWTRTLSTMFAAGVPLVGGARLGGRRGGQPRLSGGDTGRSRAKVSTGTSLTVANAERRRVPHHGGADGVHRRGIRASSTPC